MGKTYTGGNVIIEDIQIGDIHYEYDMNLCIKSKVISLPKQTNDEDIWRWKSVNVNTGQSIDYLVNVKYATYSPKLYDYEAYTVKHYV